MKNSFGFTPGPWKVSNDPLLGQLTATIGTSMIDNKDYFVMQDHTQMHDGDAIGDAKLISCAPEMLDALIQLVKYSEIDFNKKEKCLFECKKSIDCHFCINYQITNSIEIIEKATGKQWEDILENNY